MCVLSMHLHCVLCAVCVLRIGNCILYWYLWLYYYVHYININIYGELIWRTVGSTHLATEYETFIIVSCQLPNSDIYAIIHYTLEMCSNYFPVGILIPVMFLLIWIASSNWWLFLNRNSVSGICCYLIRVWIFYFHLLWCLRLYISYRNESNRFCRKKKKVVHIDSMHAMHWYSACLPLKTVCRIQQLNQQISFIQCSRCSPRSYWANTNQTLKISFINRVHAKQTVVIGNTHTIP